MSCAVQYSLTFSMAFDPTASLNNVDVKLTLQLAIGWPEKSVTSDNYGSSIVTRPPSISTHVMMAVTALALCFPLGLPAIIMSFLVRV